MRASLSSLILVVVVGTTFVASPPALAGKKHSAAQEPSPPDFSTFENVPYAKFTNAAFAADFEGKWIKVDCTFAGTNTSYSGMPGQARLFETATPSDVFFMINRPDAPAGEMLANPLAGQIPAGYAGVYMAKQQSDPLFTMTAGQKITVYGYGKKYSLSADGKDDGTAMNQAILRVVKIDVTPPQQ